ncbi:MAG: TIGR00296 family protein [Thermoplasmata archaeon]
MFSEAEGEAAVRLARWSIEAHLRGEEDPKPSIPDSFSEKRGAFVTLNTYPERKLRGCIGYAEPVLTLQEAVVKAATSACHDPRLPPLQVEELDRVVVEVSLLTAPQLIEVSRPLEYTKAIVVGRDGLIIRYGGLSGLLLPQVAVEWKWDAQEFLSQACIKAGLLPDAWFEPGVEVYGFRAEVFSEVEPRGSIARKRLSAVHDSHRG